MKFLITLALVVSINFVNAQVEDDKAAIEKTCMNYLEGFYEGDQEKLKDALKPRLYKFGYWKNKDTNVYDYYKTMSFDEAIDYAKRVKEKNQQQKPDTIKQVKVLDVGNTIAAAKVVAWWGIDYMLLSKEDGKWMIEQVIWEGPLNKIHTN